MNPRRPALPLPCLVVFSFLLSPGLPADPISCLECHELKAPAVEQSVHRGGNAGCVDCHGGNPEPRPADENERVRKAKAHDRKMGFAKFPDGACAKCHGEVTTAFDAGPHGASLKAKASPLCWDCHASNPEAPTAHEMTKATLALFANTCVRCHKDRPELVAMGGEFKAMFEPAVAVVAEAHPGPDGAPDPIVNEYHETLRLQHGLNRKAVADRVAGIVGRMPVERPYALAWLGVLGAVMLALFALAGAKLRRLRAWKPAASEDADDAEP